MVMKTISSRFSRKTVLAAGSVALLALLPSCLPPPPPGPYPYGRAVVAGPGFYAALPPRYAGEYYLHQGRYYYGGVHQVGRFRYQGRVYPGRYLHNGQYFYGGVHHPPVGGPPIAHPGGGAPFY
jgi:hypothetical protein